MITKFKIFESDIFSQIPSGLTSRRFVDEFHKLRNASVDQNIPSIPGRFYWKIHKNSLGIIEASLHKIGAPKSLFDDIKSNIKAGSIGSSTDLEIWYTKDWKTTGRNTWLHKEWNWREWEHGKKLKGYHDYRYKAGYKYMGVVMLSKEEKELYSISHLYNL